MSVGNLARSRRIHALYLSMLEDIDKCPGANGIQLEKQRKARMDLVESATDLEKRIKELETPGYLEEELKKVRQKNEALNLRQNVLMAELALIKGEQKSCMKTIADLERDVEDCK